MADPETIDHAAFERMLERPESGMGASEVHGLLCGLLCTPVPPEQDAWLQEILGAGDPGKVSWKECREALLACCAQTARQLSSSVFRFDLLLPDDEHSLIRRSESLAAWCGGFLFGLGMGGVAVDRALGDDTRELLEDFAEFTRIQAEPGRDASQERDFMELVEYVRVGVLLVREELVVKPASAASVTRH